MQYAYVGNGQRIHITNGERTLCGSEYRPGGQRSKLCHTVVGNFGPCDCKKCTSLHSTGKMVDIPETEIKPIRDDWEKDAVRVGDKWHYTSPEGKEYAAYDLKTIAKALWEDGYTQLVVIPF